CKDRLYAVKRVHHLNADAIATWHDLLPSGEHRLVAQAGQKAMFGLGVYLSADGLAFSYTGAVRRLNDDELTLFR
ncbi:MAG: hypothetical protein ACK5ZP_09480, partial [Betaproteobacteria bacterium]